MNINPNGKSRFMSKVLPILFACLLITEFTGCNTIGGAGKDLSAAGHDVTKAARKVQKSITN